MLEGGMFHTASVELAIAIVAAARSRPWLASAIRRSTRRPESAGWVVEFLRYPRWSRLCEDSEITEDDSVYLSAHAEAHRNAAIGAEAHDAVFWDRLTQDVAASGFDDFPSLSLNDALISEVSAWSGPPEPASLPEHWRLFVEREALRQSAFKQSLQFDLVTANDVESLASTACRFAEWELGAEVAIWIGEANGRRGVGAGSFVRPEECSRREFEREHAPWYFRQSRELKIDDGMTAIIYAGCALEGLEDWSSTLAKSRALELLRPMVIEHASIEAEVEARYWSAVAEFGAGAGHTINNPLGAIAGLAERLLDDEHKPDRRASLHKIRTQVDRIHRMIRDLHLLGRQAKSTNGVTSVKDAVHQGVAKALARFADKPTPRCTVAETPSQVLIPLGLADAARLVEELVANGIDAAGPQGFVEVQTVSTSTGVEIRVVDSGPGFSASELANAFSPFFAGRSAGRGLGMGLPVCRRIVERAGGRLVVRRTRPTTVAVHLPTGDAVAFRRAA
jgi:signal transduction histidine kinase